MSKLLVDEISDADNTGPVTVTDGLTVQGAFTSLGIDDNATGTAMTLDSSGNVGIGTTSSPARLLHVNGSTGSFRLQGTSVGGYIEIVGPTSTNFIGTPAAISSGSTTDLGFYLSGTERLRIDSSGHLIAPYGITLGTAAGTYAAANTLDDYEEGTWAPTIGADGGDPTVGYGHNTGTYTKVGNLVTVFCTIITSSVTGGSGHLTVDALPFFVNSAQDGAVNFSFKYNWITAPDGGACQAGTNRAIFYKNISTNVTSTPADLTSGVNYLIFSASYTTA